MSLSEILDRRRISEVLHFTTHPGLVGIFQKRAVLSRARLPEEKYLEHIYKPNCDVRKDTDWLDYVNLSISRINPRLFAIASGNWHRDEDIWWVVLSFDPIILTHEGVQFCTTNNMYSGIQRGLGPDGLEALFAPKVVQYVNYRKVPTQTATRHASHPDHLTTCAQAEVLYPGELSLTYLKRIYVRTEDHQDRVYATASVLYGGAVDVVVSTEVFSPPGP